MDEQKKKEDLESAGWSAPQRSERVIDTQSKVLNDNVELEKY